MPSWLCYNHCVTSAHIPSQMVDDWSRSSLFSRMRYPLNWCFVTVGQLLSPEIKIGFSVFLFFIVFVSVTVLQAVTHVWHFKGASSDLRSSPHGNSTLCVQYFRAVLPLLLPFLPLYIGIGVQVWIACGCITLLTTVRLCYVRSQNLLLQLFITLPGKEWNAACLRASVWLPAGREFFPCWMFSFPVFVSFLIGSGKLVVWKSHFPNSCHRCASLIVLSLYWSILSCCASRSMFWMPLMQLLPSAWLEHFW